MELKIIAKKKNGFKKLICFYESDQLNHLADRLSTDQLIEIVFYLDSLKNGLTYSEEISE